MMVFGLNIPVSITLGAFSLSFFIACPPGNFPIAKTQQALFSNAPGSPLSIPDGPGNVLLCDMNGDRKPDLIVTCGRSHKLMVLAGKGDGQFDAPLSQTTLSDS